MFFNSGFEAAIFGIVVGSVIGVILLVTFCKWLWEKWYYRGW